MSFRTRFDSIILNPLVTHEEQEMNPLEICLDFLNEVRIEHAASASRRLMSGSQVKQQNHSKTKYAVRITPVLATCYASEECILKAVQPVSRSSDLVVL